MKRIESERIYFRDVRPEDASGNYFEWMNNPEIVQYTESRFGTVSRNDLVKYIEERNKDKTTPFFAIVDKKSEKHIGNIKIGPISLIHRYGDIGIIIGEKDFWGKGYATEAIKLLVDFSFKTYNLNKITAGCYENNLGSIKAFQKAGFEVEYRQKKQVLFEGKFIDGVKLCIFNPFDRPQ